MLQRSKVVPLRGVLFSLLDVVDRSRVCYHAVNVQVISR